MGSIGVTSRGSGLRLALRWAADEPATLTLRGPGRSDGHAPGTPLVEALAAGHGREWAGRGFVDTAIGRRLRYRSHRIERLGEWQTAWLTQYDDVTGLEFTSELAIHDDALGMRGRTHVHNAGAQPITLHAVTSLVFGDFGDPDAGELERWSLLRGRSDWLAEGRFEPVPLRTAGLPDLHAPGKPLRTRGCIEAVSLSSWPTAYEMPVAVLADPAGFQWSFQVEHNGGWCWQLGERSGGVYLALLGPTDEQHQWQLELLPGESFATVPAALCVESAQVPPALPALTGFRRASMPAPIRRSSAVVFNDYMNTVMGDPTADVLYPLVDAAAEVGADYFVIDAGWYADGADWWDAVGEWQPSNRRFPDGLARVLEHVRRRGLVPGLWLEPEVVGVQSPMAVKLPDAAFLQRAGVRVVDHGRYHLDLTCEAATAFLDEVVDRLVTELGVGYLKLDYNIRAGVGSDAATRSPGHGLLLHNRAYLGWLEALRQRHPGLVLENCASGGMREDFATVSRVDLQSTSDQEDFRAYPAVAAAAPMMIPPEQAANWAYPQPEMSDDEIVYTLCTGLLGRLYLSGWLHRMTADQRALVAAAVAAHKRLVPSMDRCRPFWPLGLPAWGADWVALGLHDTSAGVAGELHVAVWKRSGDKSSTVLALPSPPAGHRWAAPVPVFPRESPLELTPGSRGVELMARDPLGRLAARVVTLRAELDE